MGRTIAEQLEIIDTAKQGVAAKIRDFGGTVPTTLAEYPSAVSDTLAGLVQRTVTAIDSDGVTAIADFAFYANRTLRTVRFRNATRVGGYSFRGCTALTSASFPAATVFRGGQVFSGCTSLAEVSLPSLETISGTLCFQNTAIAALDLPSLTTPCSDGFTSMHQLRTIRLNNVSTIPSRLFGDCDSLAVVDFRGRTLATVPALENVNAFQNTPTTRKIVVPDALYSSWIAAPNWSSTTYNIVGSIVRQSDYEAVAGGGQ